MGQMEGKQTRRELYFIVYMYEIVKNKRTLKNESVFTFSCQENMH